MKTLLMIFLPLVVLALGGLGGWWLVESKPPVEPAPPVVLVPTVRTIEVTPSDFQVEVPTQGTVVPRTESSLVVQVGGRVIAVSPALAAGGFFEQGEVLLQLESQDYELALAQAELAVAQAERRLAEEEADAAVARREWGELGQGEPSPLALHEPQVKEVKSALAAAEAGRARAELDLDRTKLTASFAGRVRAKNVDLGQYLMPGSVVARVYAVDYVEVRLPLPDNELAFLDLPISFRDREAPSDGPLVRLSAHFAGKQRIWPAHIVRTEGEIDPRTRMVMAVARVEDPYGRHAELGGDGIPLAVGMFVEAAIRGRVLEDVYVLPRAALRDGTRIYTLEDDGRLHMIDIELVRSTRDDVVVRSAELAGPAQIIVSPLEVATEGMMVRDLAVDVGAD